MSVKIYSYPNNPRVYKSLIAAQYNGVTIELPPFEMGKDNKSPEFLEKINPLGKVPAAETPDGPLWESNAIARYVARLSDKGHLYGRSVYEAGLIEQWIEFTRSFIEMPASAWLYPIFGFIPNNPEATKKAKGDIRKVFEILNKHLASRTFLVGERITLADIIVSMNLFQLYSTVLEPSVRRPYTNVNRWFTTLVNQPQFKAVIGEFEFCTKAAVAPEPEEPEEAEEVEEEKPKKKGKGKQQKPEAEKPAAPSSEGAAAEEEKPRKKNPLDLLPKSKLDLEEWKRVYSNTKDGSKAMEWFWEHYDPEGYCIYFSDFKYNSECTQLFMTLNKLNGFMQRLEHLHKYAFGNLLVFGDEPNLEISCCWLFRGTDVPPDMLACDDYELYEWRKANPENEADKKLIEAYWTWTGDFGGKVFHDQGKVFK